MSVIVVQRRRARGYIAPSGGIIMWNGNAASLVEYSSWSIYTQTGNVLVKGATSVNLTSSGSWSHAHSNPSTNSTTNAHSHTITNSGLTAYDWDSTRSSSQAFDSALSHGHYKSSGSCGTGGAAHTHTLGNTSSASAYPPHVRLYWIRCSEDAEVPLGGIIMFSKPYADRPSGFVLCNGSNSTPDMRDRFVWGASSDAHVHVLGGATTHVHSQPNTGSGGSHRHLVSGGTTGIAGTYGKAYDLSAGATGAVAKNHTHSFSSYTSYDSHSHTTANTASASNVPKYIKLYYLMRVE